MGKPDQANGRRRQPQGSQRKRVEHHQRDEITRLQANLPKDR